MEFDKSGVAFEHLLARMEGGTLVLTFNRPEVRNAINWTMEREFFAAMAMAERDPAVTAVVLNGAGEMFSAGHDLKSINDEIVAGNVPKVDGEMWSRQSSMLPTWDFHKPFIAAVHNFVGPYANGILLTADFIIAAEGTKFSFEHSRTAVGRPWGPYPLMTYLLPPRVFYKLWALGGWMDAEQAAQLHYIQRIVPMEELESTALHWAEQCALIDPEGFAATKQGMHELYEAGGLLAMGEVARKPMRMPSAAAVQKNQEFNKLWAEKGIKAALAMRDAGSDPDFTQV